MPGREEIEQAIATLEAQRPLLGDAVVNAAIESLRKQLPDRAEFVAERKWVTIMFADISGFTALSETRDPEEVRRLMNRCFDHLVPVVRKYKGTIDKYIGDEIMALFGAPVANEQHAEFGCACALDMMKALQVFNRQEGLSLGLHIGMNTGLVVAGGVGSTDEQQYSVMGDAVNLGARLKDKSTNGQIFVGPDTYAMTRNLFSYEPIPPLALKGKAQPVPVYSLLARKELAPFQNTRNPEQVPLIGRSAEMEMLDAVVQGIRAGEGATIGVVAEAGIGKSRLVKECRDRHREAFLWVEGRSLAHLEAIGYVPVQDMLKRLARRSAPETAEQGDEDIRALIESYTGPSKAHDAALLTLLANLVPSAEQKSFISGLDPASLRLRLQQAFIGLVAQLAAERPLVMVWEDVHWADPDSLDLIEAIARQSREIPVCQMLLFRPEKEDLCWKLHEKLLAGPADYRFIELDALDATEVHTLMRHMVGSELETKGISSIVFERTEGNPFYTEELVRSIRDKKQSGGTDEDIRRFVQSLMPQSFQSIVAARIDGLPPMEKRVLQTASVMGRIIDPEVLRDIMQTVKSDQLEPVLRSLEGHGMVRSFESGNAGEMIFRHAIVQEVAYGSMLIEKRKSLHTRCAEVLGHTYGDRQAFVIARHYEQGDDWRQAVHYYDRAAQVAAAGYAHRDEETALCRLTDLLQEKVGQSAVGADGSVLSQQAERSADICLRNLNLEEARARIHMALDHDRAGDALYRGRLMRKMALSFDTLATRKEAEISNWMAEAEMEFERTRSADDTWLTEWIDLQLDKATFLYWTSKVDALSSHLASIRADVFSRGLARQQAKFRQTEIMTDFRRFRYRLNADTVENSSLLFDSVSREKQLSMWIFTGFTKGFVLLWSERMQEAIEQFDYMLPMVYQAGDMANASRIFVYRMIAYRRLGRLEDVRAHLQEYFHSGRFDTVNDGYADYAHGCQLWALWSDGELAAMKDYYQTINFRFPPEGTSPFNFLYAFPMAAGSASMGDETAALEFLRHLTYPRQRGLEEDLESMINGLIADFDNNGLLPDSAKMHAVTDLAKQYRYL